MTESLQRIAAVARRDGRFRLDAFLLVKNSLAFAQLQRAKASRAPSDAGDESAAGTCDPHLTGQELCLALREYSQELYGMLAKLVLNSWGVYSTSDIGEIVYLLIDAGELRKSDHDQRSDFDDVFDFDRALQREFRIQVPQES